MSDAQQEKRFPARIVTEYPQYIHDGVDRVNLEPCEFFLLDALMRTKFLTIENAISALYGSGCVLTLKCPEQSLNVMCTKLRKKLKPFGWTVLSQDCRFKILARYDGQNSRLKCPIVAIDSQQNHNSYKYVRRDTVPAHRECA